MNRKINKITTWLAAAIFLLALAINVKVTLDDPFMMLSDEAVAQTTTSTGNTGTVDYSSNYLDDPQDCIVTDTVTCTFQLQIYAWCVKVDWDYTLEHPGTENYCKYTGNPGNGCTPFACRENGTSN